jgi:hypothetical protein
MAAKNTNAGLSSATAAIMESCVHVRRLSGFLLADFDLGFSAEAVSEPPLCCVTGAALKRRSAPGLWRQARLQQVMKKLGY